jgi:hypothetical protein
MSVVCWQANNGMDPPLLPGYRHSTVRAMNGGKEGVEGMEGCGGDG